MEKYLSVCIGCNKDGTYFVQTLQSIIALLQKNNLIKYSEICICNDSKEICGDFIVAKKYKQQYPKLFRLFNNKKNMGISYTYQKLLYKAKGKFFLVFDSDDIIADFKILDSLNFLQSNDRYIGSYGIKRLFDNDGKHLGDTGGQCSLFSFGFFCNHNAMILKREQAIQAGGYFPKFLKHPTKVASDIVMWIGMFLYKDLYFESQLRCYGRCNNNNHSSKNSYLYQQQFKFIKQDLLEYYQGQGARMNKNLIIISQGILKDSYNEQKIKTLFFQQLPRQVIFSKYVFPYYMQFLSRKNYIAEIISSLLYGALYNNEQLNDYIALYATQNSFISKALHNFNYLVKRKDKAFYVVDVNYDEWFNLFFYNFSNKQNKQ